jgi:hypothetical protein
MIGKKMATWTLSLLGALALASTPALAGDKDKKVPAVEVVTPEVTTQAAPAPAHNQLSALSVILDGVVYPLDALKNVQGELSIIFDDEGLKTGVGRAYRTREEFDAYAASQAGSCQQATDASLDTTSACVFYDGSNCTFTRRVIINCGVGVTNLNSLLTVRSFSLGCGTTFVCPAVDCSGTCGLVTGTAGTCLNVTGTVGCAGCANF